MTTVTLPKFNSLLREIPGMPGQADDEEWCRWAVQCLDAAGNRPIWFSSSEVIQTEKARARLEEQGRWPTELNAAYDALVESLWYTDSNGRIQSVPDGHCAKFRI